MSGLLRSLPNRPLRRSEVESLSHSNNIAGTYPVYDDLNPNAAHGVIIAIKRHCHVLIYDSDGWQKIGTIELESEATDGIPFQEADAISDGQKMITEHIGAKPVEHDPF